MFFALLNLRGQSPPKSCTTFFNPTLWYVMWQSFAGLWGNASFPQSCWSPYTKFSASFFTSFEKNCWEIPVFGGVCISKSWPFSSVCKNFGVQYPLGAKTWSSEKINLMVNISHIHAVVSGPKFTRLFLWTREKS